MRVREVHGDLHTDHGHDGCGHGDHVHGGYGAHAHAHARDAHVHFQE